MRKFKGFRRHTKKELIGLPEQFFMQLMPMVDDLAELKVMLFCFWALYQKEGEFRYLRRRDFVNSESLMQALSAANPNNEPTVTLDTAIKQAVERGAILRVEVKLPGGPETLYFVNTEMGRKAVASVQAGTWKPGDADNPIEILPPRPNIYQLYEDLVGTIRGTMIDTLKDAEAEYPAFWIEEAFQLAIEHNARNWAYVYAILERWSREGRDRGLAGQNSEADGQGFISGRYAAYIKHKPDE
jgi:DnaD/phage-associated family protein